MKRFAALFELSAVIIIALALTPGRAYADAVFASPGAISTNENSPYTFNILNLVTTSTDQITSTSVYTQANFGTVTATGSVGEFTYTPNNDYFGTDSFRYMATDSLGEVGVSSIEITVKEVNLPPQTSVGIFQTTENTPLSFLLSPLVTSTNGVAITSYLIGTPTDGVINDFLSGSGFAIYVPNAGFTGVDEFPYGAKAANGLESDSLLLIAVQGPSTSPVPEPSTLSLLGLGLVGITGASWYRKRSSR